MPSRSLRKNRPTSTSASSSRCSAQRTPGLSRRAAAPLPTGSSSPTTPVRPFHSAVRKPVISTLLGLGALTDPASGGRQPPEACCLRGLTPPARRPRDRLLAELEDQVEGGGGDQQQHRGAQQP